MKNLATIAHLGLVYSQLISVVLTSERQTVDHLSSKVCDMCIGLEGYPQGPREPTLRFYKSFKEVSCSTLYRMPCSRPISVDAYICNNCNHYGIYGTTKCTENHPQMHPRYFKRPQEFLDHPSTS
ncbi:hypothetical protein PGT21_023623 [Puccinia graminis f. sp. tritici]|uniref:Uncharacterized protein n=1 Tax=Puccinia graminis f. sp. tritici TaxID=56615 RepID=A0A5B0LU58_PUCGR|nr:hypothetical protein PGT21_023623 [Puccinia graminis f. sp. tritici]KAA1137339.1 hypothetical protein PGTUg99_012500 [Puccinia graminis f. sp. tritici]